MMVTLTKAFLGVLALLLAQGFLTSERVHATENPVGNSDETIGVRPSDQGVHFQDSNLDRAVRSSVGVTHNQDLSRSEVLGLRMLTANKHSIADLAGPGYVNSLTTLGLNENSINDISSISGLTSLRHPRLEGNILKTVKK